MIRGIAWVLLFVAWFWVDASLFDPAILKELFLPVTLGITLLTCGTRWRPGAGGWLFLCLAAWSLAWMRGCAPVDQTALAIGTGCLAFLAGTGGNLPPAGVAISALALAVGKGWDDLLFLRNIGGGIPFTPTSFFVHRNLFALVLAPSLFLLASWLIAAKCRRVWIWLGWSILCAGVVLLLVSESRGAALGFVAGALLLLMGWAWRASSRKSRIAALACLALVLGIGMTLQAGRIEQTRQEAGSLLRMEPITTRVPDRFRSWVWKGALSLWREAPIVGIGVGEFRYGIESVLDPWVDLYRDRRVRVDVAHSHWLQTMVERGVVGLILEASLWMLAVGMAYRSGRRFLAAALLCMGVHGLVGEGLEYTQGVVMWWFLIGQAVRTGRPEGISVRWLGAGLLLAVAYPLATVARTYWGEQRLEQAHQAQSTLSMDDLTSLWESAPRSPAVLLEIATMQARRGDVLDARRTLEHRKSLCPRSCALGGEVLLAGVWRVTGATDSADGLLRTCMGLYPTDPWLIHDLLRQRRAAGGCASVGSVLDSMQPKMDSVLAPPRLPPPSYWPTWRHLLVVDSALSEAARYRTFLGEARMRQLARIEWVQARSMCADSL